MKKRTVQRTIRWAIVLVWMGLIFYLSHQPGDVSSELSSGVLHTIVQGITLIFPFAIEDPEQLHFILRKGAHFSVYFFLGIFIFRALKVDWPFSLQTALIALVLSSIYAISDEVHQLFIPGRSGEVRDVLIDSLGALVGISFYMFLIFLFQKRKRRL